MRFNLGYRCFVSFTKKYNLTFGIGFVDTLEVNLFRILYKSVLGVYISNPALLFETLKYQRYLIFSNNNNNDSDNKM